jgi:hypothetical protein
VWDDGRPHEGGGARDVRGGDRLLLLSSVPNYLRSAPEEEVVQEGIPLSASGRSGGSRLAEPSEVGRSRAPVFRQFVSRDRCPLRLRADGSPHEDVVEVTVAPLERLGLSAVLVKPVLAVQRHRRVIDREHTKVNDLEEPLAFL